MPSELLFVLTNPGPVPEIVAGAIGRERRLFGFRNAF